MALPTSGQLTFSQIWTEVYWTAHSTEECSMFQMATDASLSTTNASVSNFYGYSGILLTVLPTSMIWLGSDSGSGFGITATVTIQPDATFTSTIPTWITRTYNYTANTMLYYPNSVNPSLISARTFTSTVSASGYPSDTILLRQNASAGSTHTPNAPTCLLGSTLITMSDETQKPIEELKNGDKILSYNYETGKNEESIVEKVLPANHYDMVIMKVGDVEITCTIDHPFLGDNTWLSYMPSVTNQYYTDTNTEKIEVGMNLHTLNGKKKISSIKYYGESTTTYQIIKLSKNTTYYANTLLTKVEEL